MTTRRAVGWVRPVSAAVSAGCLIAVALAGCASLGTDRPTLSSDGRDALDLLYADPLFAEAAPGAGELLGEDFQTECGEEGSDPIGGRTWVLLDGGEDSVAYYRDLGREGGWQIVEERDPDPHDPFGSRRASLIMERTVGGYKARFAVLIGRSNLHDEVEIGAHGSVDDPSLCR